MANLKPTVMRGLAPPHQVGHGLMPAVIADAPVLYVQSKIIQKCQVLRLMQRDGCQLHGAGCAAHLLQQQQGMFDYWEDWHSTMGTNAATTSLESTRSATSPANSTTRTADKTARHESADLSCMCWCAQRASHLRHPAANLRENDGKHMAAVPLHSQVSKGVGCAPEHRGAHVAAHHQLP